MIVEILICVCIITGAALGKPIGWVVLALGVLALLLAIGGAHFHIG